MDPKYLPPSYSKRGYEVNMCEVKNMILLGKTGVGKTTFLNMITNPERQTERKVYSQTRSAELNSIYFCERQSNTAAVLRIIDTPGIFENREKTAEVRTNQDLLGLVFDCIDFHLTQINIVGITIRGDTGFNEQEVEACNYLISFLGPTFSRCALLIVTNTEMMNDISTSKYIEELRKGDKTKSIVEYCKFGIIFTGSMDKDTLATFPMLGDPLSQRIVDLRDVAISKIMESPRVELSKEVIQFAQEHRRKEREAVELQRKKCITELQNQVDTLRNRLTVQKQACSIQ